MKKIIHYLIGVILFLIIVILSRDLNKIDGHKLEICEDMNGNTYNIPILKILKGNSITLKTTFENNNYKYIVFPEVSGNYAEIYLNNKLISILGYNKNFLANLYLKPFLIKLDNLKEKNILEVKIYDLYKGGFKITPTLLDDSDIYKYYLLHFINYGIISSIGGIILFLVILLFSYIYYFNIKESSNFFYYLLSLVFLFIATRDFHFFPLGNSNTFLLLKKIFFISFLLSFIFFFNTININKSKIKYINNIIKIILIVPITLYILSKDFSQLMFYYNNLSWIPALLLIYIIFLYRKDYKYTILFTFLSLTIIHDLIIVNYPIKNERFLFSYGIFSYVIFIGLILVDEIRKANIKAKKLYSEVFF
ncbi:hypothetical protein JCM30566_19860 [Marinitoga arctica]